LFLADFRKVLALLWLGPLGSTLTYLYWLLAIERVNVSSAALTLFIQPIAGSFLGILALDEGFTMTKGIGASLILAAVGMLTPSRGNS
jgi:drug/metabolite transporter (DMT)-like permease